MSDTLTPAQVKRDQFLRGLAVDPGEGLRYWKRLDAGEQMVVVTYMTFFYDLDFAKRFKANADKHKRPDLVIFVTNFSNVTPQSLSSQGFKLQRTTTFLSTMQYWVNPIGREVWLITSAKFTTPDPPVLTPIETKVHPDIQEIREYVNQYSNRKKDMIANARALEAKRGSLSPQAYKDQRAQWWKEYGGWDDELDDIEDQIIPDMDAELTPHEQDLKNQAIKDLKKLRESWPADVMDPPH